MVVLGVYFIATSFGWMVIAAYAYSILLNDLFCHRICSHGMYPVDPTSKVYKALVFLASVDMGYGPVRELTVYHEFHHRYSDQNEFDLMNWRMHWYSTCLVIGIPVRGSTMENLPRHVFDSVFKKHSAILSDPWTTWCSRNNVYISIATLLALAIVWFPAFQFVVMGRATLSAVTVLSAIVGHIKDVPFSYRNFNTKDTTSNNLVLYYLTLGLYTGILQNNHHGLPKAESPNPKWWEVDCTYPFMLLIKHLTIKH